MKNKITLLEQTEMVDKYLYETGMSMGKLCKDKSIPKNDKKWIKQCVLSIIQVRDLLCVMKAYNNVCGRINTNKGL